MDYSVMCLHSIAEYGMSHYNIIIVVVNVIVVAVHLHITVFFYLKIIPPSHTQPIQVHKMYLIFWILLLDKPGLFP